MKKVSLHEYYGSFRFVAFYDEFFKSEKIKKDAFLKRLDIIPSSFRRARISEQKVGKEIVEKIAKALNHKVPSAAYIREMEAFFNLIYRRMYFKKYDFYENDILFLKDKLKDETIFNPIIKLMLLFLNINHPKGLIRVFDENYDLFNDVKKYVGYFSKDLLEILNLIELCFEDSPIKSAWSITSNDPMAFAIASRRLFNAREFASALFFGEKAKSLFSKDECFYQIATLNEIIMSSYLALGNYKEAYDLGFKQMMVLQFFAFDEDLMKKTKEALAISVLGLKKYDEIIEYYKSEELFSIVDITVYLVALYTVDLNAYNEMTKKYINSASFTKRPKEYFEIIEAYISTPHNKRLIKKLETFLVREELINVLKEYHVN